MTMFDIGILNSTPYQVKKRGTKYDIMNGLLRTVPPHSPTATGRDGSKNVTKNTAAVYRWEGAISPL